MAAGVPHIEEQRNDPRALNEGLAAARALPPNHLVEMIETCKQEAEDATKDQRMLWQYWWDLWQNHVDYPDKEDWQAQVWVPKTFTSIEHGTSLIQRSLLDADSPFNIEALGQDPDARLLATHVWEPLIRLAFTVTNFYGLFTDVSKIGMITGLMGYLKFRWTQTQIPQLTGVALDPDTGMPTPQFTTQARSFLTIEVVEPWKIFRDPHGSKPRQNFSGAYLIHSETKQRPELKKMVKHGWNLEAVDRLLATKGLNGNANQGGFATNSQQQEAERKDQKFSMHPFRVPYMIDEFWGDILDRNGDAILPDGLVIRGDREILAGPVENPLWATSRATGRRKWPFLASCPLFHPTRFEGRGIAEGNADLARLYANLFCLFMDGLNWKVNAPAEVFQDALADWEDLSHYPGKLWIKKQAQQAFMPANMGNLPVGEIMGALEYIDRQRQNSDFVSDMVIGQPGSRSNITLGEVEIKTNESHGIFESIAKNMEMLGEEAVEMAQDFIAQFQWDLTDPLIQAIIQPHNAMYLMSLPPEQRMRQLGGRFAYKFTGVSQSLYREQALQKTVQFAQLIASDPYATIIKTTRPEAYLEILLAIRDLLRLADQVDLPEVAEFKQQLAEAQQAAQAAAQAGAQPQPGAPGAPGAPGQPPQHPQAAGKPPTPNTPAELLKQQPPTTGGAMRTPNPVTPAPHATDVPNPAIPGGPH